MGRGWEGGGGGGGGGGGETSIPQYMYKNGAKVILVLNFGGVGLNVP